MINVDPEMIETTIDYLTSYLAYMHQCVYEYRLMHNSPATEAAIQSKLNEIRNVQEHVYRLEKTYETQSKR